MSVRFGILTFDCADAVGVAAFWSAVLEHPVDPDGRAEMTTIGMAGDTPLRPGLAFVQVPEPKVAKNRLHVDLAAADMAAEVDRIIGLGAKLVAEFDEAGSQWVTLTDPEGNEFNVVSWDLTWRMTVLLTIGEF